MGGFIIKVNKLEIFKGACIVAGGIAFTTVSGTLNNSILPDTIEGKGRKTHKVIVETYNDDSNEDSFYKEDWKLDEAIVLKTPFKEKNDGLYERTIYYGNTSKFSDSQIELIKENYNNQKELFIQDFVIDYISEIKSSKRNGYIYSSYETIENLPENNYYELSFVTFKQDYDDIVVEQFDEFEKFRIGYNKVCNYILPMGCYAIGVSLIALLKIHSKPTKEKNFIEEQEKQLKLSKK